MKRHYFFNLNYYQINGKIQICNDFLIKIIEKQFSYKCKIFFRLFYAVLNRKKNKRTQTDFIFQNDMQLSKRKQK